MKKKLMTMHFPLLQVTFEKQGTKTHITEHKSLSLCYFAIAFQPVIWLLCDSICQIALKIIKSCLSIPNFCIRDCISRILWPTGMYHCQQNKCYLQRCLLAHFKFTLGYYRRPVANLLVKFVTTVKMLFYFYDLAIC